MGQTRKAKMESLRSQIALQSCSLQVFLHKMLVIIFILFAIIPINAHSKEFGYGDLKIGDPISKILEYCSQDEDDYAIGDWYCFNDKKHPIYFLYEGGGVFVLCDNKYVVEWGDYCPPTGNKIKYENIKNKKI